MIFGVGSVKQPRSESCKIVPSTLGGFFQIRKDMGKRKKGDDSDEDDLPKSEDQTQDETTELNLQ